MATSAVIDTDRFAETGHAVEYSIANHTLTIAKGVNIGSKDDPAIYSGHASSTLINDGEVLSTDEGVGFDGYGATIINKDGAKILTWMTAIRFDGFQQADMSVENAGTINSVDATGVVFDYGTHNGVLNNYGFIGGNSNAVTDTSGGTINNAGTIQGESRGLYVSNFTGELTEIDNMPGGLIAGSLLSILSEGEARVRIDNRGTFDGAIDFNAPPQQDNRDVITNRGEIIGDVFLGTGDDKFTGKGNSSSGGVFGEGGEDMLTGGKSDDTLNGGSENDVLKGGEGRDKLFGGTEADTFDFDSIDDSVVGGKRDKIMDMDRGTDLIDVSGIDAKTGVSGNQKFKWIGKSDFHDKKGEIRYEDKGSKVCVQGDVNGDGDADFEIYVKVGALGSDDFVL